MKKLLFVLSLALPFALSNISDASAQRKNSTEKDVPNKVEQAYDATVDGTKKAYESTKNAVVEMTNEISEKFDKKDKKHSPDEWMKKENHDINEDYEKALRKINKSSFSQDQKNMLMKQASENKNLAIKQIKEKSDLMKKHWDARKNSEGFKKAMKEEKANRKAVKEVREILD